MATYLSLHIPPICCIKQTRILAAVGGGGSLLTDCYNHCYTRCSDGGKKKEKRFKAERKKHLKVCIYNDYYCFYSCVINRHYILQYTLMKMTLEVLKTFHLGIDLAVCDRGRSECLIYFLRVTVTSNLYMKILFSSLNVQLHLLFILHYLNFCLCHHNFHN